MRLTLRLTLGILIGLLVTWLVNVGLRIRREEDLLQSDIRKDNLLVGRALSIDLVEAWGSEGPGAALRLAERMNADRTDIGIRAFVLADVPTEIHDAIARGEVVQRAVRGDDDEHLITWLPLQHTTRIVGALRLEESLGPAHAYVRTTLLRTAVFAGIGLGVSALLSWLFGYLLIGRRIRELVAKARRVGTGDFSGPIDDTANDELGMLARELNAMCEQLIRARQDLEKANEEHVEAVRQLRHADRLSTVGQLSAGIAHELGTPLNIVSGRARLIADAKDVPDGVVRNAQVVAEQAQRMTRIVRQLLDFARARRPDKASTDVAKLARDTADMLSTLAQKQGVALEVEAKTPTFAPVDAAQLQQAVTNLVVNAVQASAPGQRVSIRVDERRMDPPSSAETCIAVVDEGVGMDDDQLHNVFSPFFTTKDVGEGTGLGLAVAWGIVQEHGGTIRVKSQKARGSTFTIHLPQELNP